MAAIRMRQIRLKKFVFLLATVLVILFFLNYLLNNEITKPIHEPPVELKQVEQELPKNVTIEKIRIPLSLQTPLEESQIFGTSILYDDEEKRNAVREIFIHAWKGYKKHAWGANEINIITGKPHNNPIFGYGNMGATIIDALDTMYIMKYTEDLPAVREWIRTNLNFNSYSEISLFEFNIRFLGGLLSIYSFTRDPLYLDKAKEFADSVLPAFNTVTGMPRSLFNLQTKTSRSHSWGYGGCAILAEFGTLHMEFAYLSELTRDPVYYEKVKKIRDVVASSLPRKNGLYFNNYNPISGESCGNTISFGGAGDSFYEYLLKENKRTAGQDVQGLKLYQETIDGAKTLGLFRKSQAGTDYLSTYTGGSLVSSMEHLTCFMGGLLAYGAQSRVDPNFELGATLTSTCHLAYDKTKWKLGPDRFSFKGPELDAVAESASDSINIQRPETVESYFYMWRLTKDQKYRDWAWAVVQAINKTRTEFGFGGVKNVYLGNSELDPIQQSFFLAETLKYLYLIFCPDDVLSLDRWVFNTEAHPMPIYGRVKMGPAWSHSAQI